jgi:hypothetical protein
MEAIGSGRGRIPIRSIKPIRAIPAAILMAEERTLAILPSEVASKMRLSGSSVKSPDSRFHTKANASEKIY